MAFDSFENLEVYKKARNFRREISDFCKTLPQEEKYRLVDQKIRASRSITNQIAEGFGRFHYQENIQFCRIARGSLDEVHEHLNICFDESLISDERYETLLAMKTEVRKILNGYISYLNRAKSKNEL